MATRAIWLHWVGELMEVWNYSSIGEGIENRGDSVFDFLQRQHGVTTESYRRPLGNGERINTSVVMDAAGLIAAARAAGIEMANEWEGWRWPAWVKP